MTPPPRPMATMTADGTENIYQLLAWATRALKMTGHEALVDELKADVMATETYEDAKQVIQQYVEWV